MVRRLFLEKMGKFLLLFMALGTSVVLTGCAVMTDILNWVPAGLTAVTGVLTLLSGAGIVLGPGVALLITAIQAGLTDLKLAVQEYQSTTPPPVGALAKIDTFLSDLVNNIGNVLRQLPQAPIISLVVGIFQLVLSMIEGFVARMPAAATTGLVKTQAAFKRPITVGGKVLVITPRANTSKGAWVRDYNKLVAASGHSEVSL
jgi:hypothetical protein